MVPAGSDLQPVVLNFSLLNKQLRRIILMENIELLKDEEETS
jgi:hypothetical protein